MLNAYVGVSENQEMGKCGVGSRPHTTVGLVLLETEPTTISNLIDRNKTPVERLTAAEH